MRNRRATETRLAKLSLVGLAVYAPTETIASWQMAGGAAVLLHPGFWHSLTGMALLFAGARHSLRARPRSAPGVMCAAHAWFAATFWHAATLRLSVVERGEQLFYGSPEIVIVIAAAVLALAMFVVSLFLTYRAGGPEGPPLR